jgi:hypothetical protein
LAVVWFSKAHPSVLSTAFLGPIRYCVSPDLVENLGKVGGSHQRLDAVEACLWQGDVQGAIAQFDDWQYQRVTTFIGYLNKHQKRIVNYGYYQAQGISMGSGTIESTVSKLDDESKYRAHSGIKAMCRRC